MSKPFVDLWGKLDRAHFNTGKLVADVTSYMEGNFFRGEFENDPDTGDKVVRLRVDKMPPADRWAIRSGEIVYHLRSGLDHAIEQLTIEHKGFPLDGTQFPIFTYPTTNGRVAGFHDITKKGEPERRSGLYMIRGVRSDIQTFIETMQPYHRGNDLPTHPLWVLSKLSNIDKHRTLPVVVAVIASTQLTVFPRLRQVSPTRWIDEETHSIRIGESRGAFEPDAELARASGDVGMECKATIEVTFGQGGPAGGRKVVEVLLECLASVIGIVRTLESLR